MLLLLPRKNAAGNLQGFRHPVHYGDMPSLRLRFNRTTVYGLGRFCVAFWQSVRLVIRFRPDLVVGFGTLACVPVFFTAWLFRIKTLLHEQNVVPGKANKVLAVFADAIAVSFEKTRTFWNAYLRKTEVTGNPLRKSLIPQDKGSSRESFGLAQDCFTILAVGGSQASKAVNAVLLQAARILKEKKLTFQIVHLAGHSDAGHLRVAYAQYGIPACVLDFCDHMERAYSAADCAVTRAGATTVSELIHFALPAIVIPYPYAHAHQSANASVLSEAGAGVVFEEKIVNPEMLAGSLERMIIDRAGLFAMAKAARCLESGDASDKLVAYAMRTVTC